MFKYPYTRREDIVEEIFGKKVADPYRWLEDSKDKAVQAWDKAQNEIAEPYLKSLPDKDYFFNNFKDSDHFDVDSIPRKVKNGSRRLFTRQLAAEEKSILMLLENADAEPKELINPNNWAKDEILYHHLVSNTGRYLSYGVIKAGKEDSETCILDIDQGILLPDKLLGHKQFITSWLPDDSGFYYRFCPLPPEVPAEEQDYWQRTYLHLLGTPAEQDKLIFAENKVKEIWSNAFLSYDQQYLIYRKGVFYKSSTWIERYGSGEIKAVMPEMKYDIDTEIFEDHIYILTNENAPRRCIYKVNCSAPERKNWKLLIEEKDKKIEDYGIVDGKLFINYLDGIYNTIEIYDTEGAFLKEIKLPGQGIAFWRGYQDEKDIYIFFCNPVTPYIRYKYDFENNTLQQDFVYINPEFSYNKDAFVSKIEYATSKDGTRIPLIISHSKDMRKDGSNPVILYGYGGFNSSTSPNFSAGALALCKRGGIYVSACLRGGGEFGEKWHEAGMKEKKQNVFDDFIAAAIYLINEKYTSPEHLGIMGGSNGGLLTGACLVQKPELFAAAVVSVPLLDMIRYHKNKFANIWKEEYGSAENEEEFNYLLAYSPYHNIDENAEYPATLVTGGFNDSRCDPYHGRKFAAGLQYSAQNTGNENPLLCLINYTEGHGFGGGKTQRYENSAQMLAFLLENTIGKK
ncbi:MAG: prolyl oligopeptidase family serine peptidase [Candidatus Cloacimonetes bacterium]|nr:prolyl oligopeptidase family serine peptidase [Candidatus Cloacimonadota bacterium]